MRIAVSTVGGPSSATVLASTLSHAAAWAGASVSLARGPGSRTVTSVDPEAGVELVQVASSADVLTHAVPGRRADVVVLDTGDCPDAAAGLRPDVHLLCVGDDILDEHRAVAVVTGYPAGLASATWLVGRACRHLIQSRAAARQRTPVKLTAVFS